jgi:RNA polymerase sigma factor (sigma-70 family)
VHDSIARSDVPPAPRSSDAGASVAVQRVPPGAALDVESLYEAFADRLFGFALGATRDREAAQEVVQEAFVRLVAVWGTRRAPSDPGAWLFTVAANLVRSRGRRIAVVGRWLQRLAGPAREQVEAAEDTVLREERDDDLRRSLERLPEDQRMALLLTATGFSGREIAVALGRSEGSTRTLLWRARVGLRDLMEREVSR